MNHVLILKKLLYLNLLIKLDLFALQIVILSKTESGIETISRLKQPPKIPVSNDSNEDGKITSLREEQELKLHPPIFLTELGIINFTIFVQKQNEQTSILFKIFWKFYFIKLAFFK